MSESVLIVGAGPVGLTMAIELARYGVPVRIVDKAAARTDKSKAVVIWSRPLELLERSGCTEALLANGYRVASAKITADKKLIAQVTFAGIETKYPFALVIPQSETERVLEEFLNGLGVRVERGVELARFTAQSDKVRATLRRSDGGEQVLETAWLIGCDGAHSTLRHQLGMAFRGDTLLMDWILADVHLKDMPCKPEIEIVWHPEGVLATFPIGGNRYRVIADVGTVSEGTDRCPDPTLAEVQSILDRRFPQPVRAVEAVWLSSFRINERKVADYRAGRVFLAGDAAHVHSPAGGQGMNTGMQDACNLAWKLALVARGLAGEKLLASYSPERSPIAEQVLKVTGRATTLATTKSEVAQFLRNHTASLILGLSPVRKAAAEVLSEISIGYPHSPLSGGQKHHKPLPGSRAPIRPDEPPIGAGDTPRFALCGSDEGMPADLLKRHGELLEPFLRVPYDAGGLWLVRPDGYVALAAPAGDWNAVSEYLDSISGGR